MIEIDKYIPIPTQRSGRNEKYPLNAMEIGDSFFVASIKLNTLRSTVSIHARRHAVRFKVRKEGDGARVWRIE